MLAAPRAKLALKVWCIITQGTVMPPVPMVRVLVPPTTGTAPGVEGQAVGAEVVVEGVRELRVAGQHQEGIGEVAGRRGTAR